MSYPEHEKLAAVAELSQAQGDFVEWLAERGFTIGKTYATQDGPEFLPASFNLQELLARYHGIDRAALEAEKQAMLDACRERSAPLWTCPTCDTQLRHPHDPAFGSDGSVKCPVCDYPGEL